MIKSKIKNAQPFLILIFFLIVILPASSRTNNASPIDLPTALRLAGAQNLDVQIAREKLREAKANHDSARLQFLPWISPGISYRQHDNKIQDVQGNIVDVHKYSYAPGAAVGVQLDLGDAIYKSLVAKQLAHAAEHEFETQRRDSVLAAAQAYFDLIVAQSAVAVAKDAVHISSEYEAQLTNAVGAGIAFKGDLLRVRVQTERNRLALRQAQEEQRLAAARLSQVLHLDPSIDLLAQESELAPLTLIETNAALDPLVQSALAARPELKQSESLANAARDAKSRASYGPLIPSIGAQGFWGGLGGGRDDVSDTFGAQQDYVIGASWKIGPGGLFDFSRVRAAESRWKISNLATEKWRDEITRQVVEQFTRWQSLADQLETARIALSTAEEGLRLAQQRREFAVGVVLEAIQAEQDLTRARLDYVKAIGEFNKAQYALSKAIGKL